MKVADTEHRYILHYDLIFSNSEEKIFRARRVKLYGFKYWIFCKLNLMVMDLNAYFRKHNYSYRVKVPFFKEDTYKSWIP